MSVRYLRRPAVIAKAHKAIVTSLYRDILDLGGRFPDTVASDYIVWRARNMFHRRAKEVDYDHAMNYVREARKARRQLSAALSGSMKDYTKVLELAYGARGRLKHVIKVGARVGALSTAACLCLCLCGFIRVCNFYLRHMLRHSSSRTHSLTH